MCGLSALWKLLFSVYLIVLSRGIIVDSRENGQNYDCQFNSEARNLSFLIPSEQTCNIYVYTINCSKNSSIITISTFADSYTDESEEKSILITFKENTTFDNGTRSLITISQWTITPQNAGDGRFYFSRTSQLQVDITVNGDWSKFPVKLFTDEVDYNGYEKSSGDASGEVMPWVSMKGREYRPNSVFLFRINGHKVNSIDIILENLDIDVGVGEYLLIGAGSGPFEGPPPLYIFNQLTKKEYKIFHENAYIVFVTSATRSNRTGFKIKWKHDGTKPPDEGEFDRLKQDDVLQSVQVCIYNKSAALAEFNKTDPFLKFRKEISEIASTYLSKENNPQNAYRNISHSQVEIFRVSDVIRENEGEELAKAGGFYVMVKIWGPEKGSAALKWNELQQIIHEYFYSSNHSTEINDYKIWKCPARGFPNKWDNIGFYVLIPILCCVFLGIWAFRHSRFADAFSKNRKGSSIPLKKSQNTLNCQMEKVYEASVPQICVTHDQGRRYTSADDDSDVEVYNRNNFRKPSSMHDLKNSRKQSRILQQGETNAAFVGDDGSGIALQTAKQFLDSPVSKINEEEHFYDTVKSTNSLERGDEEDETKL